ncbi:hypothetical protein [Vibrio phage vB_pir03]|nr:hypothetical protein [Vibrio phage vB_pir03]
MFTMFQATLNEKGSALTGKEVTTAVTKLDPKLLDALGFRVVSDGRQQTIEETAKIFCNADEAVFLEGCVYNLRSRLINLQDLVFLNQQHVTFITGCMRAEIKIDSEYASFVTADGWSDKIDFSLLIPEGVFLNDAQVAINRVLNRVEFAPKLNTGGYEDMAELVSETFKRMKGNLQMFKQKRVFEDHYLMGNRSKYVNIQIRLLPADSSDLDILDRVPYLPATEKDEIIAGKVSYWKHK